MHTAADWHVVARLQQEISFQVFRNQLLANGLVDKLEVSNKNLVKVYVRGSAPSMNTEGAPAQRAPRAAPAAAPP